MSSKIVEVIGSTPQFIKEEPFLKVGYLIENSFFFHFVNIIERTLKFSEHKPLRNSSNFRMDLDI